MTAPTIIAGARVRVRIHNGRTGQDTDQYDSGRVTRVLRGGRAADVEFDDGTSCVVECSRITAEPAGTGRLLPDAHPRIRALLDHALDHVGVDWYGDNGWHGADLRGDGGHLVRLTAESDDPGEEVRLLAFSDDRGLLVRWTASFDGAAPLEVVFAALAEALR